MNRASGLGASPQTNTSQTQSDKSLTEAAQGDDYPHLCSVLESRKSTSRLWDICLRLTARWPLLFGFVYELRSFRCRMALSRKLGWYKSGQTLAPDGKFDLTEYRNSSSRLRVRNEDMRRLGEICEWVSLTDCWLFDLGWDQGAEWGKGNLSDRPADNRNQ
jgi:hypothetical protein